jgi:tripartite-type tricarboxylate transporter receptor subunit TctC
MTIMSWLTRAFLSLMIVTAFYNATSAQESEKAFYSGKTVRMIVGSGTGGGYDVFSRMIAPYLAKTLGTTVIVENQPGAGGLIALNRLFTATPDGLQISLSNGTSAAFAQLTGDQAAPSSPTSRRWAPRPGCGSWVRILRSRRSSRRSTPR